MKFNTHLSKLLDNPAVDKTTGMVLETDGYEKAARQGLVSDELYQAYVRYVGKLNALPHEELKIRELTNTSGQVFAIPSWPTKMSRQQSSATWTDYNAGLNKPKPETDTYNPCANPDASVDDMMKNCIKNGQRIAKWDINTATNKCTKQVGKFKQAIDNYCKEEKFLQHLDNKLSDPE